MAANRCLLRESKHPYRWRKLESHLREDIEKQICLRGRDAEPAFRWRRSNELGDGGSLKREFWKKFRIREKGAPTEIGGASSPTFAGTGFAYSVIFVNLDL